MIKLISIFLILLSSSVNNTAELTITIKNIDSNKGQVIIGLCNSESTFPKKPIIRKAVPITEGKAVLILSEIKYGEYAISVLHDKNNNGKLDFHFYGPPSESTAASNNAKRIFGPPLWKDAKFSINKNKVNIIINM